MTEALLYRVWKALARPRRLLPLLSAVLLLCFPSVSQAHGIHAPAQGAFSAAVSHPATGLSVTIVSRPRSNAQIDDHDCPDGSGHVDHIACAGVSCHAVANGTGPATDFQPAQSDYERLAMTVGDGRTIAPP